MRDVPPVMTPQRIKAMQIMTRGMTRIQRRDHCAALGHTPTITGAPYGTSVCVVCAQWRTTAEIANVLPDIEEPLAHAS